MENDLAELMRQARDCRLCADSLPLGPRPILRGTSSARLLIVGQAPGTRVHETGIPWNDRSGQRLRLWLNLPPEVFYDETKIAIIPVGLCYPGRDKNGGDRPPRPECAPLWHPPLIRALPLLRLTLLVGSYAQAYYLGTKGTTMTETVRRWRTFLPRFLPLPHPSWRTNRWERDNPWFGDELLPEMRQMTATLLGLIPEKSPAI